MAQWLGRVGSNPRVPGSNPLLASQFSRLSVDVVPHHQTDLARMERRPCQDSEVKSTTQEQADEIDYMAAPHIVAKH